MIDTRKIKKYSDRLVVVSDKLDYDIRLVNKNLLLFYSNFKKLPDLRYVVMSKRISLDAKLNTVRNIFLSHLGKIELEFILLLISLAIAR